MRRWLPLLVLAMIIGVNLVPFDRGSMAFGSGGAGSAVVQGDTRVIRDVLAGPYPHVAWNPFFLVADLFVAAVLVTAAHFLAARFGMAARQGDAADRP